MPVTVQYSILFGEHIFLGCTRKCFLGTGQATKADEFLENLQTAFDLPSFLENYVAIIFGKHPKKTYVKVQNLQDNFFD